MIMIMSGYDWQAEKLVLRQNSRLIMCMSRNEWALKWREKGFREKPIISSTEAMHCKPQNNKQTLTHFHRVFSLMINWLKGQYLWFRSNHSIQQCKLNNLHFVFPLAVTNSQTVCYGYLAKPPCQILTNLFQISLQKRKKIKKSTNGNME